MNRTSTKNTRPEVVVEYHWHRIIGALLLLAALLWGTWVLFFNEKAQNSDLTTLSAEKQDEPRYSEAELGEPLFYDAQSGEAIAQQNAISDAEQGPRYTEAELGAPIFIDENSDSADEAPSANETEVAASPEGLSDIAALEAPAAGPTMTASEWEKAQDKLIVDDPAPAGAAGDTFEPEQATAPSDTLALREKSASETFAVGLTVLDPRLNRAQLASGLRSYEPVDALPPQLTLDTSGVMKVFFFSELKDLKGQTVYHQWFQGDKQVARITIRPHRSPMRASSSKFINQQMVGEWTVKVVTSEGILLGEYHFVVEPFRTQAG